MKSIGLKFLQFAWRFLVVVATVVILSILAMIPSIRAGRTGANEVSAIRTLASIHQAQVEYLQRNGRYADSFQAIGSAAESKSGYNLTLAASGLTYQVRAEPVTFPKTGRRCFFSDQTGVIRENWGSEAATADSPEIK